MKVTQDGSSAEVIRERNAQARKAKSMLNKILWDRIIITEN